MFKCTSEIYYEAKQIKNMVGDFMETGDVSILNPLKNLEYVNELLSLFDSYDNRNVKRTFKLCEFTGVFYHEFRMLNPYFDLDVYEGDEDTEEYNEWVSYKIQPNLLQMVSTRKLIDFLKTIEDNRKKETTSI